VQCLPASKVFVVGENLFAQLIDELIETQIDFSFDFVVQKLFAENGQRIVSRIVIEIKGEKYAPGKHKSNIKL
jgi:hypothetical protein